MFFASIIILIILMIILIIIKIVVPMYQFLVRSNLVIKGYSFFKDLLKEDFSAKEKIIIPLGKYKMEFANTNEASIEFERLVNDALEYYNRLGWIAIADSGGTLKEQQNGLIKIRSEIRTMRWQKQGI